MNADVGAGKYAPKVIACKDCGIEFIWTESEQEFYALKNLMPPKRCVECRCKNKEARKQ